MCMIRVGNFVMKELFAHENSKALLIISQNISVPALPLKINPFLLIHSCSRSNVKMIGQETF